MKAPRPSSAPIETAETPARAWMRALETVARATRDPNRILPRAVGEWARRYGDAPALIGVDETLSFRALEARMNQYSRWALALGVERGETIALMMGNRPDYFAIWLGLTQIGAVAALIGADLAAGGLAHALRVAGARRLIVAAERREATVGLDDAIEVWTHGGPLGERRLDLAAAALPGEPLASSEAREVTLADRALRIFTSGTTGLPKAAEVSHRRIVVWSHWFAGLAGLTAQDRLYDCLPMHHSVGGVVAIGAPLVNGGSVVVAERFSASRFWDDIARHECTVFQYIGELCRYLVAAPERPSDKTHRIRIAIGNGLSGEVWRKCLERFGPIRVLEFYASTEGNVWLYNVEGRIGSIGRVPPYLAAREPIALARFDADAGAPRREADGFCRRCADDEVGEALGRIGEDGNARFEGYSQAAETEKKIFRDVFSPGDAWMRTGDLMRRDGEGFYHFVDRIGDTFRWKGENVATTEVVAALSTCPGVAEAIVYGVAVPHAEGRAGMALLRVDGALDLDAVVRALTALPRPARPLFLRVAGAIEATETFKPKRRVYVDEGFDPAKSSDPLYVFDAERGYVPLDAGRFARITSGAMRF